MQINTNIKSAEKQAHNVSFLAE